jgi:hypothetical protein
MHRWCAIGALVMPIRYCFDQTMTTREVSRDLRQQDSHMPAEPAVVVLPGLYGRDRILTGARFLGHLDPGWWREGALLPASLTALDMADPYRCILAWWAARHLPAPSRRGPRQVPPYDRAMLALCLSSKQAQALGFTGADADLLTPGWRHLITNLRASADRRAAVDPALLPERWHPPRWAGARGHWPESMQDADGWVSCAAPHPLAG